MNNNPVRHFVQNLLHQSLRTSKEGCEAFAPVNIALCKYWGKRDSEWNLPETNSLSISLKNFGTKTRISESAKTASTDRATKDQVTLNGKMLSESDPFVLRLKDFLDLFRPTPEICYHIETESNIPISAGLASSASGFAALVLAIDKLYALQLDRKTLSILARLGSGSACRSLWEGFVEWQKGNAADGSDSHGVPLNVNWPSLRVGVLILNQNPKSISSRIAMEQTRTTSFFFDAWKKQVEHDLSELKKAIQQQNFATFGELVENNAQALHGLMMTAKPSILYSNADTVAAFETVRKVRNNGLSVYFTQDAGPNLKLFFQKENEERLLRIFPNLMVSDV